MKTKNKKATLLTAVSLILLFFTACGTSGKNTVTPQETDADTQIRENIQEQEDTVSYGTLSEGDAAPDFTADLADESTFTLSEQQGKIVLLNFWATWCGPCVREMPAFEKLCSEYGDSVAVLAVNCMEAEETVNAFLAENGYTFPVAYDTDGEICMKYPSQGIPYTLVIDADGIIRNIYIGAADAETQYQEYKSAIDAISE